MICCVLPILSYPILSYPILSYPILSYATYPKYGKQNVMFRPSLAPMPVKTPGPSSSRSPKTVDTPPQKKLLPSRYNCD
ncbi:hypothetical protein EYC80_004414 [Monilinia laxa]|uniref:Uncharacterized protein n=1 Tax=Monilinia laxa TaxID=61186 RepID=A0A5N6KPS9_MONLA|nr:hypothetical protein EYC80_004414 [Monilinia laxa]